MASGYQFSMSLGFRHPDVDPAWITRALALQPEHVWQRGDQRRDLEGVVLGGAHRESFWICEFSSSAVPAAEQAGFDAELVRILQTLRRSMGFMQHLHHSGGAAELFVSVSSSREFRLSLPAEEAAMLGRMGIALTIEVRMQPAAIVDDGAMN